MFSSALKSFQSNINSNYTVAPQPSSFSGPWKIFDAKQKKTGKVVSVFVFDRKSLEPQSNSFGKAKSSGSSFKRAHDEVVEGLKREASSLARLRHPSILELAEPVEETRNGGLMFATEPVTASLAGLLQEKDEQERAGGIGGRSSRYVVEESDGTKRRRELEIDELEIQKGLLQLGKGLEFLHESATLVHANLTPDAIFINAKSDWKISGLGFSGAPTDSTTSSQPPIALSEILNQDPRLPASVQLNLDYSSPDFVIDSNASSAADMFSLGLLIIALYNSPHKSPIETHASPSSYKRVFSSSSSVPNQTNNYLSSNPIPRDLVSTVLPRLITRRPAQRMSAREFQQSAYFDNILVSTMRFLDDLPAKTPNEKAQFMRGLARILDQFPRSVLERKVLPALLEEMKDRELIALILQNVFKITELLPSGKKAFTERVIPRLREVFLGSKSAASERDTAKEAGLMVLLEKMNVVAENSSGKEFKDDVLPIIVLALESPTHSIVDAALGTLRVILQVLDFSTVKNELFPVIAAVFAKTSSMGIKIRGLEAFQVLCGGTDAQDPSDDLNGLSEDRKPKKQSSVILDKYSIQEKVVPLLKAIKTKEPAVMMAALNVFKEVSKICDTDFLALEVLPILWSFGLGPLLNLEQFADYMNLIKGVSARIEDEHKRKLQDLSATNAASSSRSDLVGANRVNGTNTNAADGEVDFESLVLGKKSSSMSGTFDGGWDSSAVPSMTPSTAIRAQQPLQTVRTSSEAPSFAWSTPASPPAQSLQQVTRNASLAAPLQPTSRTVTPDQALGSFAALTPTNASSATTMGSSFAPSLQQSRPALAASPWGSHTSPPSTAMSPPQPSANTSIDWSGAIGAQSAGKWGTPMSAQSSQPALSNSGFGSFSIAPPPTSPYQSFNIAPPPINRTASGQGNFGVAGQQQQQQQSTGQQRTGLDKYESLL